MVSDAYHMDRVKKLENDYKKMKKNWDDLKEYLINYREAKSGYDVSGRYCVALSIDDILKIMSEIEGKNSKI